MKVLWFIIWLAFFLWLIYKLNFFKGTSLKLKHIYFLFLAKVAISFIVYLVYTNFYNERINSDIFKYYDDGLILYNSLFTNPTDYFKMLTGIKENESHLFSYYQQMNFWIKPYNFEIINENKTLIRLNAFISLFSFNNYFIHVLIFVFLSFVGLFSIFKVLSYYVEHQKILAILVFLIPSTLFWSSAILKETLVFFSLGLSIYFLEKWIHKNNFYHILLFVFFLLILMVSKIYIFLLIMPAILFIILNKYIKIKRILLFIILHLFIIFLFFNSEWILPYNLSKIVIIKQYNFINMAKEFDAGSQIEIPLLQDNLVSFLKNSPIAIINSLFRPFIWESHNILSLLSSLENLFILLLIVLLIFNFNKSIPNNWILFSISFTIMLFILIGLTTPVLGALVRYKVPALPFLMFIFTKYINWNKILTKFKIYG